MTKPSSRFGKIERHYGNDTQRFQFNKATNNSTTAVSSKHRHRYGTNRPTN